MKKILLGIAVLIIYSTAGHASSAEGITASNKEKIETDQVIVKVKEDVAFAVKSADGAVVPIAGEEQLLTLEVPEDKAIGAFIEELEKNKNIVSAEPDHLVALSYVPNDPSVSLHQYHHQKLETKTAWDASKGSSNVTIAVIDDGIDLNHPDLKNQIVSPYDTVKESTRLPVSAHGTHVAGIIGSSMDNRIGGSGIAPESKLMPINVFEGETAYISEIIQGIHYAVQKGADIINMSFGTYEYNASLNEAVQFAHKKGVVIVAAAGNEAVKKLYYPASYPNVISVGSTTSADKTSSYSNFGSHIDIAAPGSSIYSTLPNSTYGKMSGTSMATPMVSGVAALILAKEPSLSNLEVEKRLYSTAEDLGAKGKDPYFGNGRANARKALLLAYLPVPVVSGIFNYSVKVKGTAAPNALVTIKAGSNILAAREADAKGDFVLPIPKQPAGTKLIIYSTNKEGIMSEAKEVAVRDGLAPAVPSIDPLTSESASITGKAESNAKVYAYAKNKKIGEVIAKNGSYTMQIAKQSAGLSVTVYAIDAAGNKSANRTAIVADKTAPLMPSVNMISNKSLSISGKAESDAAVYAYLGSKMLGKTVAKSGNYSMKIANQKNGSSIIVYAVDGAGNKSRQKTVKVVDRIAPPIPVVDAIWNDSVNISGKAEAHATVYAYAGKVKLGETAAKNGAFSIKIPKQKTGTLVTVYAKDGTKNKSGIKTVKVMGRRDSANYQTAYAVNMRTGASTSYQVLTVVPKGKQVAVIEKKGAWYKVQYGTKVGWISSAFLVQDS